jgi:5-methylcytosine-specific restriction protein A
VPNHAYRACSHPGCIELYTGKGLYCPLHKASHNKTYAKVYNMQGRDNNRQSFETSARWRKIRIAYLSKYPLCQDCEREGNTTLAQEVHHIDNDYTNNYDNNLMGLCTSCHSKRTNRENRKC